MYINVIGWFSGPGGKKVEDVNDFVDVVDLGEIKINRDDKFILGKITKDYIISAKETVSFVFLYKLIRQSVHPRPTGVSSIILYITFQSPSFDKEITDQVNLLYYQN